MSESHPVIFVTENDDGSADFTISIDDEDHKFSTSAVGKTAVLSYQETQSWRGIIRVKEPREEVYKRLIQSDKMTGYIESHGLNSVQREAHV